MSCKGGYHPLLISAFAFFKGSVMDNEIQGQEVQEVNQCMDYGTNGNVPFEPIYFMLGFIAGLLFISLFKGRWFL